MQPRSVVFRLQADYKRNVEMFKYPKSCFLLLLREFNLCPLVKSSNVSKQRMRLILAVLSGINWQMLAH